MAAVVAVMVAARSWAWCTALGDAVGMAEFGASLYQQCHSFVK
jgi:hypothetical protein